MDSIRIQRLRCLSDTGYIDIKPITVLVGQNSSGKSSFLRVFPLLKQSVESRTIGPILWNGRLVDFGNYKDAHQSKSDEGILLSFKFRLNFNKKAYYDLDDFIYLSLEQIKILNDLEMSLQFKLLEDKDKGTTMTEELILRFNDSEIKIKSESNGNISFFLVNSLDILKLGGKYSFIQGLNQNFLPLVVEQETEKQSESDNEYRGKRSRFRRVFDSLIKSTKKLNHQFTSENTILRMALTFGLGCSENMLKDIKKHKDGKNTWKKQTSNWQLNSKEFQELRDLIIANCLPNLLELCDNLLGQFSKNISYMGPVRATAQRYYRTQDLAVDEVDYQGINLPMFLRNLTEKERKKWQDWTFKNFQFKPEIQYSEGHVSLKIYSEESNSAFNIADTGFGFSQILPIITQLWFLCQFSEDSRQRLPRLGSNPFLVRRKPPIIFAIEQPELHLHPRLQGTLTDAFVQSIEAAEKDNIDLRLILETHSEILINRLGYLVAENKVSPDDINIVIFEPSEESDNVKVKTAKFDAEGYLTDDWPLGFFNMELD